MWAEKLPHEWLEGDLGVLGLASWPFFNPHLSDLTKGVKGILKGTFVNILAKLLKRHLIC
jgi:hypothetical protein